MSDDFYYPECAWAKQTLQRVSNSPQPNIRSSSKTLEHELKKHTKRVPCRLFTHFVGFHEKCVWCWPRFPMLSCHTLTFSERERERESQDSDSIIGSCLESPYIVLRLTTYPKETCIHSIVLNKCGYSYDCLRPFRETRSKVNFKLRRDSCQVTPFCNRLKELNESLYLPRRSLSCSSSPVVTCQARDVLASIAGAPKSAHTALAVKACLLGRKQPH